MQLKTGLAHYPLPEDFWHFENAAIELAHLERLQQVSALQMQTLHARPNSQPAPPHSVSIIGNEVWFFPIPDQPYRVRFRYIPPIREA